MNQDRQITQDNNSNYSLYIHKGDSFDLSIYITDKAATAIDITGMSITVSIRKRVDGTDLITGLASILDQTTSTGYALFQITPTMTGTTLARGVYILETKFTYDSTHIKRTMTRLVIE